MNNDLPPLPEIAGYYGFSQSFYSADQMRDYARAALAEAQNAAIELSHKVARLEARAAISAAPTLMAEPVAALERYERDACAEPIGLTVKEAWWAGYRAGKGLPPDTPRQDAVAAAPTLMAEPVACPFGCETQEEHDKHYHVTQPAPKPLSDGEIAQIWRDQTCKDDGNAIAFARAVLAAAQGEQK
jgi:hypothetical protein